MQKPKSADPCCSGCSGCAATEDKGHAATAASGLEPEPPALAGGRFVVASIGYFLGPLVLAVAGAFCVGQSGGWQLLGGCFGLALGMAAAVIVARWLVPSSKEIG